MKSEERIQIAMNFERVNSWDELFRQLHAKLNGYNLEEVRELKVTGANIEMTRVKP